MRCLRKRSVLNGRVAKLEPGHWFSEAVLWMPWRHQGQMKAITEVAVLHVNAGKFIELLQQARRNSTDSSGGALYMSSLLIHIILCTIVFPSADFRCDFARGVIERMQMPSDARSRKGFPSFAKRRHRQFSSF
eukprot:6236892-Amphidinium_carterae.1